ncbi:Vasotab [Pseudolycoriella hygida]|uniref:Vasotab n=1 Tax=Pseudolycoriella hygida TaxID=35572 RepID=A0A9Q0MYD0_9DIPT|nr:Vasotab [Pseudolycoriella hygida]
MKLLVVVVVAICSAIVAATTEVERKAIKETPAILIAPPRPNCDIMCTMQYDPVCGLPVNQCGGSKTFGNECSMRVHNCQNPTDQYYVYANHVACDSIGQESELPIEILPVRVAAA